MSVYDQSEFLARVYYRDAAGATIADPGVTYGTLSQATPSVHGVLASTYFDGRILEGGLDEWTFAPGGSRGPREILNGACVLANADGALDVWATRNVHMGKFLLYHMFHEYPIQSWPEANYVIEQVDVGRDEVTFHLRDQACLLDVPALSNVYAGTNVLPAGVEGTANDIGGQKKPWVMGLWYGFSPPCVNTSKLIYQVDGQRGFATGWSLVVKDKGVGLAMGANYVSQADMEATAPAAAQFRVWPAGGMFRLGSMPTGQVTTDGANPVDTTEADPTGGSGSAAQHIMAALHKRVFAAAGVNIEQDYSLPSTLADAGIVITGDTTVLEAMNAVAVGAGRGWTFSTQNYRITLHRVMAPTAFASGSLWEFNENNIEAPGGKTSLRKVPTTDSDFGVPVWRVRVRYKRNQTVQTPDQLAGAVSAADVVFAGQEWRTATASDASVLTQWPNAREITIDTCYVAEVDATALATALLSVYKVRRDVFQCEVRMSAHANSFFGSPVVSKWFPGQHNATLVHSRYGLSAGRGVMVLGRKVNIKDDSITYTLWG